MANEVIKLANPKADALLSISTHVKIIRLLAVTTMPCPTPKNMVNKRKREYSCATVKRMTVTAEMKAPT